MSDNIENLLKQINDGIEKYAVNFTNVDINTLSDFCLTPHIREEVICCPHCGGSYYQEGCSTRTAAYYPPIYKNGVNINPDRNQSSTQCHCLNCGKDFNY